MGAGLHKCNVHVHVIKAPDLLTVFPFFPQIDLVSSWKSSVGKGYGPSTLHLLVSAPLCSPGVEAREGRETLAQQGFDLAGGFMPSMPSR